MSERPEKAREARSNKELIAELVKGNWIEPIVWDAVWNNGDPEDDVGCSWENALEYEEEYGRMVSQTVRSAARIRDRLATIEQYLDSCEARIAELEREVRDGEIAQRYMLDQAWQWCSFDEYKAAALTERRKE